jgi:DNA-binding Lrp family transcriptional regulator
MINAAMITLGQFNILAMCLFDELDQLVETASDRILDIRGVHHVETSIAVKTIKYNARMAKITAPDELSEETD